MASASSSSSPQVELEVIHDFLTSLSLKAGSLLRKNVWFRSQQGYQHSQSSTTDDSNLDTLQIKDKDSSVDIVTDIDVTVENFIIQEIKNRFPDYVVLAEETYSAGESKKFILDDRPTIIVDPLDGTVNLTHMLPLVCISLGFSQNKIAKVGAIYAPLMGSLDDSGIGGSGTLWSGCKGRGSFQSYPDLSRKESTCLRYLERYSAAKSNSNSNLSSNSTTITPSPTSSNENGNHADEHDFKGSKVLRLPLGPKRTLPKNSPNGLLFASEWGKDRKTIKNSNLRRKADTFFNLTADKNSRIDRNEMKSGCLHVENEEKEGVEVEGGIEPLFGGQVHGLRSLGSAALDLAFTAAGSIDVFWEGGCWEWDVCAGIAILTEAGGIVVDSNPPPKTSPLWGKSLSSSSSSTRTTTTKSDSNQTSSPIPSASLGARRFLCVRACGSTEDESSLEAQERVVREIWRRTKGLDYNREGVIYP